MNILLWPLQAIGLIPNGTTASATISVAPSTIEPGSTFVVAGSGFPANADITLNVGNYTLAGGLVFTVLADSSGNFTVNISATQSESMTQTGSVPILATTGSISASTILVVL